MCTLSSGIKAHGQKSRNFSGSLVSEGGKRDVNVFERVRGREERMEYEEKEVLYRIGT
jgi:hypothetical protein